MEYKSITPSIPSIPDSLNPNQPNTHWQSVSGLTPTDTSHRISGLKPITTYLIRMRAQNKLGFSPHSTVLRLTTSQDIPSAPPTDIRVFPLSAHSLQVSFNAPKVEFRNGRLLGYYLGYKALDQQMDEHFVFKKVSINENKLDSMPIEVIVNGLKRRTKYSVVVQAFNRYVCVNIIIIIVGWSPFKIIFR